MSDQEPRILCSYFLCRLGSNELYRLGDISAERRERAPRFYDWLACKASGELNRRTTFVDGGRFMEAGPLDVTEMHTWCGSDLAGALKQVVALEDGVSRRELALFLQQLRRAIVAIVCYRLKRDTEELPHDIAELDRDPWRLGRDFSNQQEDRSPHDD